MAMKEVGVSINLGFVKIEGKWDVNEAQRDAAWELFVELATRVSFTGVGSDGLIREALTSLNSLFPSFRDILRRHGPAVAQPTVASGLSVGGIAITIQNLGVRRYLSKWHPLLDEWESQRTKGGSIVRHESEWALAATARAELDIVSQNLTQFTTVLADACDATYLPPIVVAEING